MKRVVPIVVVGVVLLAVVGTVGYVAVTYTRSLVENALKKNRVAAKPISYDELVELQGKDATAEQIESMVACFSFEDEDLRMQAAETLSKLGAKALAPVRAKLDDPNPKVRFYAIQTLGFIGPDAADAADDIRPRLKDDSSDVRYKAAYALGSIGVKSDAVIDGLVSALADTDDTVSDEATKALEKFGSPAAPKMYQLLKTSKGTVRVRILASLARMGPPPQDALETIAELAKEEDHSTRQQAITLLGKMGAAAVPTFKELLAKPNLNDLFVIYPALKDLGPNAKTLLAQVDPLLEKSIWLPEGMNMELVDIYKKCGADGARGLAAVLQKTAGEAIPYPNRLTVLQSIGSMGSEAKSAVPVLIELLQKNTPEKSPARLRPHILEALGDIGPAARDAIPAVEALTKEPGVAAAAATALRRLGVIEKKEK